MHPITKESFAIIDREIGSHSFSPAEYAILRRTIHSTADFELANLIGFSPGAIEGAIAALRQRVPVVVDVTMVKQGVAGMLAKTFGNFLVSAVEGVAIAPEGKTRTETGMLRCFEEFPEAIFAIGNSPTALKALCRELKQQLNQTAPSPALIIGAPVGFVLVEESKAALAELSVPQIRIDGRKGGSPVAAAILNALIVLAWEREMGEII